jgi:hypothetical protein
MRGNVRRRGARVCTLLVTAGIMAAASAGAAQAATPIGTPGPGSTCDPNTNGTGVAQLCGSDFTADPGNPGPYTVANYQDLSTCPDPYIASLTSITTTDTTGTPSGTLANGTLGSAACAVAGNDSTEVGGTAPITGTHLFSGPAGTTYTVTTSINYQGQAPAGFCLAAASCPRTATSTATVGPGLSVVKNGPATATAGQLTTYSFDVTNNSAMTTYGPVTVTDVLPSTVFFSGGSPGCAVTGADPVTGAGGTVTCPVADSLAPGGTASATIAVVPTSSGTINNSATASGTAQVTGGGTTTSPPSNTVTTVVAAACTATQSGPITGSIVVRTGQTLCLTNATVTGSVIINPGGGLVLTNSTVGGSITSTGATAFQLCGSRITGGVSVSGTTGQVRIGGDAGDPGPCAPNTIGGSVSLTGNTNGVDLVGNRIGGGVSARNNAGAIPLSEDATVEIESNRIVGALSCTGNTPSVTNDEGTDNRAAAKLGQCTAV